MFTLRPVVLFAALVPLAAPVYAAEATDMGPAAFLWPPDRTWSAAWDNVGPCGSNAVIGNRTDYPLTNGAVALVLQDESYDVQVGISWDSDPDTNSDFEVVISSSQIKDVESGHECYSIPSAPSNISAGDYATLQIKYVSAFDTDKNETYYACADIVYVEDSDFSTTVPCFNVSIDDPTAVTSSSVGATVSATATSGSSSTATSGASSGSSSGSSSGGSGSKLTKGDIAGIVVGSVGGVSLFLAIIYMMWRRQKRLERALMAELHARDITAKQPADSVNSVSLRNM